MVCIHKHSGNQIFLKKGRSRCYAKSPDAQDTITDLTVCITYRPARESLIVHAWMKWVHLTNGTVVFV